MGEFSLVANGVYRALHHFRRGSSSLRVDDSVMALLAYGLLAHGLLAYGLLAYGVLAYGVLAYGVLAYGYGLLVYGLLDHYR